MGSTLDNLAALVGFATVSRSSNVELVDWCASLADAVGGLATVLPGGTDQANLLLRFGPDAPGGLLLAGHSDVVPAGDGWSSDPFRLTSRGDAVVGRGTADMKGFIASALAVAESVDPRRMRAPLHVAISFDEEIGCQGVHGLLDHLRRTPIATGLVVVGEPTTMRVCTAHAGKVAFSVDATAVASHSSRSGILPSAVSAVAEIAVAVADLQRTGPGDRSGFLSTNVGHISGGAGLNVIAPHAALAFEARHDATVDVDEALVEVWRVVSEVRRRLEAAGGGLVVQETIRYPGLAHRHESEPVRRMAVACATPELGTIDFGCEAGLYASVVDAPVVICGPGDIADAHGPDEFVTRDQLRRCDSALAAIVDELCVLTPTTR